MIIFQRNLIVIISLSLAIIGLGAMSRFSRQGNSLGQDMKNIEIYVSEEKLKTDKEFFEEKNISTVKSTTSPKSLPVNRNVVFAKSYLVANLKTGKIYLEKNPESPLPIASVSKLVTAIAALDILKPEKKVTITEDNFVTSDMSGLTASEEFTVDELLYPLLLTSSNVAAEALSSTTDRINFLESMSSFAWEIGMESAYFGDPSGLSPLNRASALDLFALSQYVYRSRPELLSLTKKESYIVSTTTEHGYHEFVSIHPFVKTSNFIGGKTGRTPEAGDTMISIFDVKGEPIAIIILGSKYDGRASDTSLLLEEVRNLIP